MILGMIIIISILNVIGSNLTSYSVLHKHWQIDNHVIPLMTRWKALKLL